MEMRFLDHLTANGGDPIKAIIANEKDNFTATAYFNPFKFIHPTQADNLGDGILQTWSVFAGYNVKNNYDSTKPGDDIYNHYNPKDEKWFLVPLKTENSSQGLFSYLLGLPSYYMYILPPAIPLAASAVGAIGAIVGYSFMEMIAESRIHTAIKLLTSPLWLTLGLAFLVGGAALAIAGLIGYGVAKAALYIPNLIVQRAIVPGLSWLVTGALCATGILPLVHGIVSVCTSGSGSTSSHKRPQKPHSTTTGNLTDSLQQNGKSWNLKTPVVFSPSHTTTPSTTGVSGLHDSNNIASNVTSSSTRQQSQPPSLSSSHTTMYGTVETTPPLVSTSTTSPSYSIRALD